MKKTHRRKSNVNIPHVIEFEYTYDHLVISPDLINKILQSKIGLRVIPGPYTTSSCRASAVFPSARAAEKGIHQLAKWCEKLKSVQLSMMQKTRMVTDIQEADHVAAS